jgi:hypothetical protein
MFFRIKKSGPRQYLQIVENRWEDGRSRQRVIATLGRADELAASGQLDGLLRSGARFADSVMVLSAAADGTAPEIDRKVIGPPLVFERLWTKTGCRAVIGALLEGRRFEFPVERAVFLAVLHRLFVSGSDRHADKWHQRYAIEGTSSLVLHHAYRAMAWLGEELPAEQQTGATPFAPRCVKDLVEEGLFAARRDLFSELDLVFFDTTSVYFEGKGGQRIGRYGKSKDKRPDRRQMVVGMVLDGQGRPICCEMWPGNTTDVSTLLPIADRLRMRFGIRRVCIVADAGMISAKTRSELETRGWAYILAARMRNQKEVRDDVLGRAGRYRVVRPEREKAKDPSPLKVKEVRVEDRRYVVCLNEEHARKDAHDREAILQGLRDQLRRGDKSLVGNKGYQRYLTEDGKQGKTFAIDEVKIAQDARYDGKWVLSTNLDSLDAAEVALKYKQLWMVEDIFRTAKSILDTRPIYHKCDETIRGHVFCTFLALVLRKALQDALEEDGHDFEWKDVLADLDDLEDVHVVHKGKHFVLRTEARRTAGRVCQTVGVALPPTVRQLQAKQ